ncbi:MULTISPECIES: hypothetical protein [unclassified Shewanella]|uniref:hypothetical protein n=1 Tax=unclassified Shewanella TaxID=196818 RepID=UPI0021D94AB4|nr:MULTISPECIES: hypothetical protein [unclassified Shewanella]MCU8020685.1 hypothetical protein [Shewanella sp. SM78]MCU8077993.1 hypothetical protein [Shewanella sp. SM103]
MSTVYSLRINYDTSADCPERIFKAMALYVEGFNELQAAFLHGYSSELKISSTLNETRSGSLIADIGKTVSKCVNGVSTGKLFDLIANGIERKISCVGKVDSESDVRQFADEVYSIAANDPEMLKIICKNDGNLYHIADALHKLDKAQKNLHENDKVEVGRFENMVPLSPTFSCPRDAEAIFENCEVMHINSEILTLRRPAYQDELNWEFERKSHNGRKITAKMSCVKWLDDFKKRRVQIWPGDGLEVKAKYTQTNKPSKNKKSYTYEIIEVIRVVPEEEILTQGDLGLADDQ